MIKEITIPEISENVEKGTVISIPVSEGDTVKKDVPLLELETDKAAVDVPAPFGGTVKEILVAENDEVKVGQAVMKIETEGKASEAAAGPSPEEEPGAAEEEPEEPGGGKPTTEEQPAAAEEAPEPEAQPAGTPVPAAPSTRRLAREIGVNIYTVEGTGPGGRISKEDVKAAAKAAAGSEGDGSGGPGAAAAGPDGAAALTAPGTLPDFSRWGETERVDLSQVRSIIAENTAASWRTIPHVTQFDKADITALEEFRGKYGKLAQKQNTKLTVTAIILKITALALLRFPRFNATFDAEKKQLILKKYVNIGVAVDTDRGLLVPVIRDADKKSILDLAKELDDTAERTRNKKIKPDELEGGNFIVSNLGGIGGTNFTPVIFPHQLGILAVDRAEVQPVYKDGEFVPRTILPLGLSYDHRVIDGADGARFLRWVAESLEQPLFMHLQGGKK
jgi:pyruvate dehydrogenase E2 component (dihydrolipoamide acetyltransferase)